MSGPVPRRRSEELLLAKVSAAAGRERIGRRCATYEAAAHAVPADSRPAGGIRGLPAFARYVRISARRCSVRRFAVKRAAAARLDLYERGLTVAVKGRIHVVRYDTTSVFPDGPDGPDGPARSGTVCTLTDVDGERIALRDRPGHGGAEEWGAEIERAVTRAQLPRALAALDEGGRLAFGDVWLTGEGIGTGAGTGKVSARWSQVRRVDIRNGAVEVDIAGERHVWGRAVSGIPNPFVLRALVRHLGTDGAAP
ncbi:DUF6585 family protein [Streptomyces luteireticuli]|uniref:DUF6585 family protein n=1 Tax=Streptomyces luteireticuli TaxID=173858 RepID=UPI003555D110